MFGSLDPAKLFVILVVALIVLGPERLPRAARQLGAAWRELTRIREQVADEVRQAIPDVDLPHIPKNPTSAISGFLTDLTKSSNASVGLEPEGAEDIGAGGEDGVVPAESFEHTGASGHLDEDPWPSQVSRRADVARPARRGVPAPEGGAALVVADPARGELAFVPDDPGMN
ncbi:MAG TPA: twin-arginine translocase TatA/TatE family subunit [Acidimicrobiales bacterium]|nr:twin-arginine translocase TatA/TatE family subunit [Acidimicrobiales bacterium]